MFLKRDRRLQLTSSVDSAQLRSATRCRHRFGSAALSLLWLLALSPLARAQQYTVTEIPPAASQTAAPIGTAINATGTVTGFIGPPAAVGLGPGIGENPGYPDGVDPGVGNALFEYSPGTNTTTDLGSYNPSDVCGSASPSIGLGMNASGQLTGVICATTETPFAFSYQGGTFTLIPTPSNALASFGLGINTTGQIVGALQFINNTSCPGNLYHPYVYDPGTGGLADLSAALEAIGGCSGWGTAINDAGQVAGFMWSSGPQAFLYDSSTGTAIALPDLNYSPTTSPSCPYESQATAINANGQVTGLATEGNCGGPEAFLYSYSDGTMVDIGNLGGVSGSQGNAINLSGQITGDSYTTGNAALHAFLYANGSMVDLNSVISASDAAQYTLEDGVAINDSGQIVVLAIKASTGQLVTVLLTPAGSVPNVVGDTQAAATAALTTAGFVLGTVTTQPSTTVAPGIVLSQDPGAGTSLTLGSSVNLVVSSGVTVPNVVGVSLSTASSDFASAGLTTGSITQQYSSTAPQGTVIAQSPAAGTSVAGGTAIDLVISEGAAPLLTEVPNLIGDTQKAATKALSSVNLSLGTVAHQASSTVPSGRVLSQSPTAGTSVAVGSAVNIILSSGPPQVSIGLAGAPQFSYNGSAWVVTIGLKNNGNVTVDELQELSWTLSGISPLSGNGLVVESLAPGGVGYISATFPVTVKSGVMKLSGTYTAGTLAGNWSVSARVSVPPVP